MSAGQLEQTLKNLPRVGSLLKDRGYRQIWRFEYANRPYYLKFYPRQGTKLKRMIRGNPAMREFLRLQWLQKASIPAPRAVAVLSGFRIDERLGDAVLMEGIEPSRQLDLYLNDLELRGESLPDHLALAQQLRTLVYQLGRAKLGHSDLHLGNFLLHERKLYLLDAYAVRRGGMRQDDILLLGHSADRFANRTDLQRGWDVLGPGGAMPRRNHVSRQKWRKFLTKVTTDSHGFGKIALDEWSGHFFRATRYSRRWSTVSRLEVSEKDWQREWPRLFAQIRSDQLHVIKRTRSGDVLEGEVVLGGRPVEVIIKHPKKKYLWRYLTEIGRGVRARRAWTKAWALVVRNVPTAWPILLMEKRVAGYVTDALIVFEKIPGSVLANLDLDAMDGRARETLFHRLGRTLRLMERDGLPHRDAKSNNWIIVNDDRRGPSPVLVDVDGVGHGAIAGGIQRLLRSMRDHPQYTPTDSFHLCRGYAPWSEIRREAQDDTEAV